MAGSAALLRAGSGSDGFLTSACFSHPLYPARRVDGLSGRLHDHSAAFSESEASSVRGWDRQLQASSSRRPSHDAIKNNAIWVLSYRGRQAFAVALAVLTSVCAGSRLQDGDLPPMAISAFATGLPGESCNQQDPGLGASTRSRDLFDGVTLRRECCPTPRVDPTLQSSGGRHRA